MSKRKGNRTRRKAIEYYKNRDYIVDIVELTGKFRKFKDLFSGVCLNCWNMGKECCDDPDKFDGFDLIAVKDGIVELTQIKTNRKPTLKNYKKFAEKYATENLKIVALTWISYYNFTRTDFLPDGTIEEEEEIKP